MIAERRECGEVIIQLMAARASLEKLGLLILNDESSQCFVGQRNQRAQVARMRSVAANLFKLT